MLIDEKEGIGVVADIHLGIEKELREKGIIVGDKTKELANKLCTMGKEHGLKTLIILGDLKHKIYTITRDVEIFFEIITKCFKDIVLVPGNHDAPLDEMKKFCRVESSRGIRIGEVFLWHGHTWPSREFAKSKMACCGHAHPEIEIPSVGFLKREPCWLVCELDESLHKIYKKVPEKIIVMPSFNPLTGYPVSKIKEIDSPVFRYLKRCRAILLNGTEIKI